MYCYCGHTQQRFRDWLAERHGSLEAVSVAWRSTPTNHRYRAWAQVTAPRSTPEEWGSVGAWLDWRRFIADDLAGFIALQAGWLADLAPGKPITTNVMFCSAPDPFGVVTGQDPWRLAGLVDAIGVDIYPGVADREARESWYVDLVLDQARSCARHRGVPLWVTEAESGPIGGWVMGPERDTTGEDLARLNMACLGAGAQMLLYQGLREWDCLPLHWGALLDLHGQPTDRLTSAAEIATAVATQPELFAQAEAPVPAVGLLCDFDNAVAVTGMGAGQVLLDALAGCYQSLAGAGFEVGVVGPPELETLDCRLLVLPFTALVSGATAAALGDWVAGGGHLVTMAKVAMIDDRGWYWPTRPGAGLDQLLGVSEVSVVGTSQAVTLEVPSHEALPGWNGGQVIGSHHRQVLRADAGTEVLGTFTSGGAALTRRRVGSGVAWAVGTHLATAPTEAPGRGPDAQGRGTQGPAGPAGSPDAGEDLLRAMARGAGAVSLIAEVKPAQAAGRVWVRRRQRDRRLLVTVTSTFAHHAVVTVNVGRGRARDLVTGEVLVPEGTAAASGRLEVAIAPHGSRMLISEDD